MVSRNSKYFIFRPFPNGFNSLIRLKITSPYNLDPRPLAGTIIVFPVSHSHYITSRRIYLNEYYLWYFPVRNFGLKFKPRRFLPSLPLSIAEYRLPIDDIAIEDLRSLTQR
jgi:hypothetical protein